MSPHFSFTKLVVADLDASARFYTEVFGLTEQFRVEADIGGRPIEEIMFRPTAAGGASFIVLRYLDAPTPARDEVIVGFVVPDADDTVARAVAAGATVVREPSEQAGHGVRVGFVRDPEGHLVEIVQRLAR